MEYGPVLCPPSLRGVEEVSEKGERGVGGCDGSEKDSEGKLMFCLHFGEANSNDSYLIGVKRWVF